MGFPDKIMDFLEKQRVNVEKENVLVAAMHVTVLGCMPKSVKFGLDEHEMEYVKHGSPLKGLEIEIEIEAKRTCSKLYLAFEGELRGGGMLHEVLDGFFDVEMEKEVNLVLDLNRFVSGDFRLMNEKELRDTIASHIGMIEERAAMHH